MNRLSSFAPFSVLILVAAAAFGQNPDNKEPKLTEQQKQKLAAAALAADQRAFTVAQLISLADEARSYNDLALRPRVLALVADAIWDANSELARQIFRRAWEAAEAADKEELAKKIEDRQLQMVAALRRAAGMDSRNEVLRIAARRDHALGEHFLSKLREQAKDDSDSSKFVNNSEDLDRRLRLARSLLDSDQVDQALAFAAPALRHVSVASISFLCALRQKRADAADERFVSMLLVVELDSASDANTVSLLSSYAFTPGYYITFNRDGGSRWSFGDETTTPPNLPPAVLAGFFKVAASVLLRPLPPPDQDPTSSGRVGKYRVVSRLMPRFEHYAPDTAAALRSQLALLNIETSTDRMSDPDRMTPPSNEGLGAQSSSSDILERMQDKLDHAKNSKERDRIRAYAASDLADRGDARARDIADKIDDTDLRNKVRSYVDFQLVRVALKKEDTKEALRLAKAGQLTHTERVWAYNQAVRLLPKSEQTYRLDLLEEAIIEARRIEAGNPHRASALFAIATQLSAIDGARTWALIDEAVNAANRAETFSGENTLIGGIPAIMRSGGTFESVSDNDFGITNVLRLLAKEDLHRSMDVAKSLKKERPRALAILAVAGAILEKPVGHNPTP